jgi:hypothetical protein
MAGFRFGNGGGSSRSAVQQHSHQQQLKYLQPQPPQGQPPQQQRPQPQPQPQLPNGFRFGIDMSVASRNRVQSAFDRGAAALRTGVVQQVWKPPYLFMEEIGECKQYQLVSTNWGLQGRA